MDQTNKNDRVLILGYGYSAKRIKEHIYFKDPGIQVFTTSRTNTSHLIFDLEKQETWTNIPEVDYCLWTFPAAPLSQVKMFLKEKRASLGKIVVIGSTGSITVDQAHQKVNESTPVDSASNRVSGEEYIRSQGGIVLLSAGIYGPDRNPFEWLKNGYVSPQNKFVNLVHVEDLAQFVWSAAKIGQKSRRYIASDGTPYTWKALFDHWQKEFGLSKVAVLASSKRPSKKVDPSASIEDLGIQLKYPNVLLGLRSLMSQRKPNTANS